MSLRDSLEIFNTSNSDDIKLLDTIYKKVSRDYIASSVNSFKINKILQAYDDFEYVIKKFELENQENIDEIKRYIIGAYKNNDKAKEIENKMKEWGLFFPNSGIVDSFYMQLIARYRNDFVVQYINYEKKQLQPLINIEYLFLVKNLFSATSNDEQVKVIEEFKAKNNNFFQKNKDYFHEKNDISDMIMSFLLNLDKENEFINKYINISTKYTENLLNNDFLLSTIKDLIDILAKSYDYGNYFDDLHRIYLIQSEINNWVNINNLPDLISKESLMILVKLHLISEVKETDVHVIKITELGFSIVTNQLYKEWESDKYFLELDKEVYIPFDANPLIICKYIFDKQFNIKERDYLLVFERIIL